MMMTIHTSINTTFIAQTSGSISGQTIGITGRDGTSGMQAIIITHGLSVHITGGRAGTDPIIQDTEEIPTMLHAETAAMGQFKAEEEIMPQLLEEAEIIALPVLHFRLPAADSDIMVVHILQEARHHEKTNLYSTGKLEKQSRRIGLRLPHAEWRSLLG
jgi:hypothetical protein